MSKYNNFADFMQSVINEADNKCNKQYGKSLKNAYPTIGYPKKTGSITTHLSSTLNTFGKNFRLSFYYNSKILPKAVKETSDYFKSKYESNKENRVYIDLLEKEGVDMLLGKCTVLLNDNSLLKTYLMFF